MAALEDLIEHQVNLLLTDGQRNAREPGVWSGGGDHGKLAAPPPALMYSWHGKYYLGAAHGLVGILTVLLQVKQNM